MPDPARPAAPRSLALLAAGLAVGFLAGRLSAPPASEQAAGEVVHEPVADVEHAAPGATGAPTALGPGGDVPLLSAPPPAHASSARAAVTSPVDDRAHDAAVHDHGAAGHGPGCGSPAGRADARRLARDPAALSAALRRFETSRDPKVLGRLAAALGRIADPAVEALALRLARHDTDVTRRTAALEILDALDAPAARAVALEVLERDSDRALRRAAVYALPPARGAAASDAVEVVTQLTGALARDPDPELRRRAAVALGRWRRGPADLRPVLTALADDSSPEVRAGCAYACELAGVRSRAVLAALVAALEDRDPTGLVAENAWKALRALGPLPAAVHARVTAFGERRAARGEAGR